MIVLIALIVVPALGAAATALQRTDAYRIAWLLVIAWLHAFLLVLAWTVPPASAPGSWLTLDALGLTALSAVSLVFLAVAFSAVAYLRSEGPGAGRWFVTCLLGFLASASLVAESHHLGLLWIGMEATTLSVAPLVFHRRDRRSLEAVWKYLVLSSVGIAFALLGTFLIATAQDVGGGAGRPLLLDDLIAAGPRLDPAWVRGGFIFLLVGYGTKMGIAPLHTWKPDTYGEAPSLVGGLMAGALTTAAFVGLARATQVVLAAGQWEFARPLLLGFALVSLVVATAFILIGQTDLKRLLAYSSVEHMGLLVLGLALGGVGTYGATLHLFNNALAKAGLFLVVGNVALGSGGSSVDASRNVLRRMPLTGALLIFGLIAITGSPPFGPFISELTIVRAGVDAGTMAVVVAVVILLAATFVGMTRTIIEVVYAPGEVELPPVVLSPWLLVGPLALAVGVAVLGVYIPAPLRAALAAAATALGGRAP